MSPRAGGVMLAEDQPIQDDAFELTADAKFCYLDPLRRHASGRLLSGLYEGDGLFLLTGRAGMGKTSLLRHLSEQLKALDGVLPLCPVQVFACRTGTALGDVFGACEARLELGQSAAAPLKATKKLQQFVESNRSPVLLLDDADLPGDDFLETLVTLTELQAADRHLLSVVLAGHPGIEARVAAFSGKGDGLASNRAVELQPMADPDVVRLVRHRLRAAGRSEETFGAEAIALIVRHSAGVPLTVVRTCRRALQIANTRSSKTVTVEIVAEAINEKDGGVQRESTRAAQVQVAPPSIQPVPTESNASQTPQAAPGPKLAFSPPAEPRFGSASSAEQNPGVASPTRQPPEASLRREQHASIPEVTVGHHGRPVPRHDGRDTPPTASREAWWSADTVPSTTPEPPARFYLTKARRRGKRLTVVVAGSMLFLVLSVAALAFLMGGQPDFAGHRGASSAAGAGRELGTLPAHDASSDAGAWWRPGMPPGSVAPRATFDKDAAEPEVAEQKPLPGLSSLEVGRQGNPAAPSAESTGDNGRSRSEEAMPAPSANVAPEPMSRAPVTPLVSPPHAKVEPQPAPPEPRAMGEPQWKPAEKAEAQPKPTMPAAKPAALAGKPLAPQAKPAGTGGKAISSRNREIETLLAEGDARLEEGDLAAARSAYEQAYDRGSGTAAARMAQTFDPRNVAATGKTASPAEAILWYQDAVRKGERRAKTELGDLASWLENSAASGNQEARRVLELWREPAAPEAEESAQ